MAERPREMAAMLTVSVIVLLPSATLRFSSSRTFSLDSLPSAPRATWGDAVRMLTASRSSPLVQLG